MTLFREKFKTVYLCPVEHLYFWKNNGSYLGKETGIDSKGLSENKGKFLKVLFKKLHEAFAYNFKNNI